MIDLKVREKTVIHESKQVEEMLSSMSALPSSTDDPELLGHADIRQTMIYAHLSPNVHHEAIAKLMGEAIPLITPSSNFKQAAQSK